MSGILPLNVQGNVDLTEATNKVVDTIVKPIQDIHKGIVKLVTACAGKWFANKDRQVELIAAQTEKDVEDVKAGRKEYRNGELISLDLVNNPDAFYKQISENNAACDAKRLGAAMLEAAIELSNIPEEEISDEPLNQTFFNHWRAEAELIDEEDLRKFWAHLLVEETKKPNSISPRTLDIVKNLSRQEAKAFEKIIHGVIKNNVIINYEGYPIGGNYKEVLMLQDARLIGSQSSSVTYTATAENQQKKKIVLIPFIESNMVVAIEKEKISFQCHVLTLAGRELYHISKSPLTLEQIRQIVEEVIKQNQNAIASILPIKIISTKSDGTVEYQYFWTPYWTNHPTTSSTEEA